MRATLPVHAATGARNTRARHETLAGRRLARQEIAVAARAWLRRHNPNAALCAVIPHGGRARCSAVAARTAEIGEPTVFRRGGLLLPDPASLALPARQAAERRRSAISCGRCEACRILAVENSIPAPQSRRRMVDWQAERR